MTLLALLACRPPAASDMRASERLSPVAAMSAIDAAGFARALAPRDFVFPQDHGAHGAFKLEWWYFVGNLDAADGRRFGFQLTFFRQALAPEPPERASAWAAHQLYLAHFALSDAGGGGFRSFERAGRGALGLAGAQAAPFRVWLEDWSATAAGDGLLPLRLAAAADGAALDLELTRGKPLVLQGDAGLSRKSPVPGNASYYYSYTRLPARGTVRIGERTWDVEGAAWLDREWSTSGLGAEHEGWDWFALQLADGRDLMFYRLRRRGGGVEPLSHGSLVGPDGAARPLAARDVELTVEGTWTSPRGAVYPALWRLRIPSAGLDLTVTPLLADQELEVSFRYWEGAVEVRGTVDGRGYVELVGYADPG
ncbi:MAG TPA: lipocalin-like domain-containing protein [Thermoanaerobaculia bacterium]